MVSIGYCTAGVLGPVNNMHPSPGIGANLSGRERAFGLSKLKKKKKTLTKKHPDPKIWAFNSLSLSLSPTHTHGGARHDGRGNLVRSQGRQQVVAGGEARPG